MCMLVFMCVALVRGCVGQRLCVVYVSYVRVSHVRVQIKRATSRPLSLLFTCVLVARRRRLHPVGACNVLVCCALRTYVNELQMGHPFVVCHCVVRRHATSFPLPVEYHEAGPRLCAELPCPDGFTFDLFWCV